LLLVLLVSLVLPAASHAGRAVAAWLRLLVL
jgi:hypothetical protein